MLLRALVIIGLLAAASVLIASAQEIERVPIRQPFASFPATVGEWVGKNDPPLTPEVLSILGADDYLGRTYTSAGAGGSVGLFAGYWETQTRGDTVHSPLNCLPGSGWQPVSSRRLQLRVPAVNGSPSSVEVNRYVIQKGLDRQMVLYWYQSHGRVVASEYRAKVFLVADSVRLHRSDTAMVRTVTPIRGFTAEAESAAEATARRFAEQLFPMLQGYIPS